MSASSATTPPTHTHTHTHTHEFPSPPFLKPLSNYKRHGSMWCDVRRAWSDHWCARCGSPNSSPQTLKARGKLLGTKDRVTGRWTWPHQPPSNGAREGTGASQCCSATTWQAELGSWPGSLHLPGQERVFFFFNCFQNRFHVVPKWDHDCKLKCN